LKVFKDGAGHGKVTSSPAGINCGTTCTAWFPTGTMVTLTATPAYGSAFAHWSGACSGTSKTCTVSMTQYREVTATFKLARFKLTVSKTGYGSGYVSSSPAGISCGTTCSASFVFQTSVTLTAKPAAGSAFGGWGGACSGTQKTCTVSMTQARWVSAKFTH